MEPQPVADDVGMDMTPMIDVVFQLIVFFLLTLRFETVDQRIEARLPRNHGPAPVPGFPEDVRKIKIKVFRRNLGLENRAYTLVRIDNTHERHLPAGWRGRAAESPARIAHYDRVLQEVRAIVAAKRAAIPQDAARVKGELVAAPPRGGAVPHGDVVGLLDAFLQAGITNIRFE